MRGAPPERQPRHTLRGVHVHVCEFCMLVCVFTVRESVAVVPHVLYYDKCCRESVGVRECGCERVWV